MVMKNIVIFTDLDGTLLDETYSFHNALPALRFIEQHRVPLVICSSKTRLEIEFYRLKLGNSHPFIAENGGGIFVPEGYFGHNLPVPESSLTRQTGYNVIRLGAQYADLRRVLKIVQQEGFALKGFGDLSPEEVAERMGLTIEEARMAKEREFDEPFFFEGSEGEIKQVVDSIRTKGFSVTKGRIFHILGASDKGRAVSILTNLYRRKLGKITTIGVGDSLNDKPMLEVVDIPIMVQKPGGGYHPLPGTRPNLIKAGGIGPRGWNSAVKEILPSLLS